MKFCKSPLETLPGLFSKSDRPDRHLWSDKFASMKNQLKIQILCGTTKSALLAFNDDSNGMWTIYNAPLSTKPRHLSGARIEIKVSNRDLVMASLGGFEPTTRCLEGSRSIH